MSVRIQCLYNTRMSQVEIDARVKAINKEMETDAGVDKNTLICNYGLTPTDYERSMRNQTMGTQLSTLIDHKPKQDPHRKILPKKVHSKIY